jgi:mannosyl-3-phosphoglycerate synthase
VRLTFPYQTERLGAVRIYGVQHVFELDSDPAEPETVFGTTVSHVPSPAIHAALRRMAVVVPCRNERLKILGGVLIGIPHSSLLVFVSNSDREPIDRFMMERDAIESFCRYARRSAVVVHQRDPGLAKAFQAAGFSEVLDDEGLVRAGKGEGMIVGIVLALLAGKEAIGFVDADNYVPGSVNEYVKVYAADLHLAASRFAMVRICWKSKPKVVDGALFFSRWGRVSETTNRFLNHLLAGHTGFGTDTIATGNAGEHAMTMDLALRLRLAGGFAIEPYQLLDMFEQFGGVSHEFTNLADRSDLMREGVKVFQVETCNPHFHEDRGDDHVDDLGSTSLRALYHSPAATPQVRSLIAEYLGSEPPAAVPPYPPLIGLDVEAFRGVLIGGAETFSQIVFPESGGVPPIPVE